jgi:hypothetical protein
MWHVCETREARTWFLWGDLRETDYLEDLDVGGRVVLQDK